MSTKIEWTDATWNPITGCTKVSQGCKHCYAERMAKRLAGRHGYPADDPFRVTLHPDRLEQPLRWRKPRMVFVCSMSDLFHEDVPDEYIDQVFGVMAKSYWQAFQVLTKRPDRMADYLRGYRDGKHIATWIYRAAQNHKWPTWAMHDVNEGGGEVGWPLSNVWIGTSVEHQQAADERIPHLLRTPAVVRFLSCEPLLGSVDLTGFKPFDGECFCQDEPDGCKPRLAHGCPVNAIDWVIVGGESGPGARPMHPDWARSLRDQCQAAGVPFFFKQWGAWTPYDETAPLGLHTQGHVFDDGQEMVRVGKKAAGALLDGREWRQWPEVIPA